MMAPLGSAQRSPRRARTWRLKSVARDLKDGSGDDKLDQVLGEIDLRVAVELAKAGLN